MSRWTGVVPVPYPDDAGIRARILDDPVMAPERRKPRKMMRRRDPGDPSCPACQASATGFCAAHKEFYVSYDPVASLGVRPAAEAAPEDRVHDWRSVGTGWV